MSEEMMGEVPINSEDWYPAGLKVRGGTPGTLNFMKSVFSEEAEFSYAEFGIYQAKTAGAVCNNFPNAKLYLFDFHSTIEAARTKLRKHRRRIEYFGNTEKFNDSYNWSLGKLLEKHKQPIFDYCFLDGAHTFAVDALNYFLCDRLLRVGGYMDFDDYSWTLKGSSLDPQKVPEIALQYTEEQIAAKQVKMIVDAIVRTDPRYVEVVPNKVFRKIA